MCLIVFGWKVHPRYALVLAANRDEFFDRPTLPLFRELVGNADIANGDYDIHWLEKYLAAKS